VKTRPDLWPCRQQKKKLLELEEELQALFREQRQAGITGELLDIISGFEALNDEDVSI